jgi:hypothetical protein
MAEPSPSRIPYVQEIRGGGLELELERPGLGSFTNDWAGAGSGRLAMPTVAFTGGILGFSWTPNFLLIKLCTLDPVVSQVR